MRPDLRDLEERGTQENTKCCNIGSKIGFSYAALQQAATNVKIMGELVFEEMYEYRFRGRFPG